MATLFAFAILTACAGDEPPAAGTDTTPDTADGAAAPMPEPAPAEGAWALSPTGLGPVHAGMSVADASQALGGPLDAPTDPACSYVKSASAPDGVSFMIVDGAVARIDVESPDIATERGARIGDTEESVQAL
jgi:hypothetical protein